MKQDPLSLPFPNVRRYRCRRRVHLTQRSALRHWSRLIVFDSRDSRVEMDNNARGAVGRCMVDLNAL
jgi:hypothetical protein